MVTETLKSNSSIVNNYRNQINEYLIIFNEFPKMCNFVYSYNTVLFSTYSFYKGCSMSINDILKLKNINSNCKIILTNEQTKKAIILNEIMGQIYKNGKILP
jgi:hypothetical protein